MAPGTESGVHYLLSGGWTEKEQPVRGGGPREGAGQTLSEERTGCVETADKTVRPGLRPWH